MKRSKGIFILLSAAVFYVTFYSGGYDLYEIIGAGCGRIFLWSAIGILIMNCLLWTIDKLKPGTKEKFDNWAKASTGLAVGVIYNIVFVVMSFGK